jgi:polysaccharide deacetylase family protein (PEP-CTERM system associated)
LKNILSFDIEEIFHGELTRRLENMGKHYRSCENIWIIIDLLKQYGTNATFFIVGETIKDDAILKELVARGHEIAFHTHDHVPLWAKDPNEFALELSSFSSRVRSVTGKNCIGFRAPSFSLNKSTSWAISYLRKNRFLYDSSVFPIKTPFYGIKAAPISPYYLDENDPSRIGHSGIIEFPLTVGKILGKRIPISGGFYLRMIPLRIIAHFLDNELRNDRWIILYIHNWELDPEIERIKLPLLPTLYCYYNKEKTMGKLRFLLDRFEFTSFERILNGGGIPLPTK